MWYPGKYKKKKPKPKPPKYVLWLNKRHMAKKATTHNNQTTVPNNKIHNGRKKLK